MADELYEVRNNLILGNFHQAIAEGTSARTASRKPEEVTAFNNERDALVAQAQVGLGQFDIVLGDLKAATAPILLATRAWASLHKELKAGGTGDAAFAELCELAGETPSVAKAPIAALAAAASIARSDAAGALKTAATWAASKDIDPATNARLIVNLRAVAVDAYLRLHRVDLAEKEVTAMRAVDDDAVLTILADIQVSLRQGATNAQRYGGAQVLIDELVARCGQSVLLLNLAALAKLGQGNAAEAEQHLLDALSKRSGDAETLANLAVVTAQLGKNPDAVNRFVTQAKSAGPQSEWVKAYQNMEQRFATAAASVA